MKYCLSCHYVCIHPFGKILCVLLQLSKMSLSSPSGDSEDTTTSVNSSEPIDVVRSTNSTATETESSQVNGSDELESSNFLLGSFSPIRTMELYPPRAKVIGKQF